MKILLDTHVLLWWYLDHSKLKPSTYSLIKNEDSIVFVSDVVIWELVVKSSIGKLRLPRNFYKEVEKDFEILPIKTNHIYRILHMDMIHRDPFDRLLIAQSIEESIPIISDDKQFANYKIHLIRP
jgi:PIN domain nuclease of toxin-antitoxin system